MRRMSLVPLSLLFLLLLAGPTRAGQPADVVLYNGKIFTVDAAKPWAQAVAIRGSRIVAVGNNGPVRALAGPGTRSINLGGKVVVPGFNDAHAHFGVGFPRLTLPPINIPGPGPTLAEAVDQIEQAVAIAQPREWILAFIGETVILDPTASRLVLDPVAPDNPVILLTWSSHSAVINTEAMLAAGIAETAPNPFGGAYDRFPGTNTVNGVIHEYGFFRLVRPVRAIVPDEVLRAEFEAISGLAAQLGVTSVQEMTIGLTKERSERVLAGADLKVRLRTMCLPLELEEFCRPQSFDPSDRLTSSGIKWLLDGTPVERSAALREPYADYPGTGRFNVSNAELSRLVRRSLFGFPVLNQLLVHTFGDRAMDKALGELERTAPAFVWRLLRPRFEHGDLLHPEQIERARRLGVIVVQNPTHLTLDLVPSLGLDRAAEAQPLRSLVEAGVHLAFGSDAPQPNPFVDLFFAVVHPFRPEEALTMEQAVTAYTRGSARAEFQEGQKGSLKPGYLADLAVLSQDIFTIAPPAIPGTVSLLTLVGGETVWDAGALAPD
jgi:predicted amidohydrolase YtcJ